jgi:hypothetical protein
VEYGAKSTSVIAVEAETEGELYNHLLQVSRRYGQIDTLVLRGHGAAGHILLGIGGSEENFLDLSDMDEIGKYKQFFTEKPTIITDSCLTGELDGIGQGLSRTLGARLFALEYVAGAIRYIIDDSTNRIKKVNWVAVQTGRRTSVEFDAGAKKMGSKKRGKQKKEK